jgi:hypothetical protein
MMPSETARRSALIILAAAAFAGAFIVVNDQLHPKATVEPRQLERPRDGTEEVLVFVASSTCGASEYPRLREAVQFLQHALADSAAEREHVFASIGVAIDGDPASGLAFLMSFGDFDELSTGSGWLNTASLMYVVRDLPGNRAIPQLILLERAVSMEGVGIASVEDRLIGRKVGADAIVDFAESLGFPQRVAAE